MSPSDEPATSAAGTVRPPLEPSELAAAFFAEQLPAARRYVERLAGDGVAHGLIGPREIPVLWNRHLLNSALVTDLIPRDARVLDVGSGAGLPGIPMALRRPDLQVTLLEPKQRRVEFLDRIVAELGLGVRVQVVRGRTDDREVLTSLSDQEWIVARAVAPLARLVGWCVPLLAPRGRLLALKGASAADEVERDRRDILQISGNTPTVVELGGAADDRTWVVSVQRQTARSRQSRRAR